MFQQEASMRKSILRFWEKLKETVDAALDVGPSPERDAIPIPVDRGRRHP